MSETKKVFFFFHFPKNQNTYTQTNTLYNNVRFCPISSSNELHPPSSKYIDVMLMYIFA
jgi:hypothetical protein